MLRHHDRLRAEKEALEPLPPSPPPTTAAAPLLGSQAGGDILYGARAIALYIFPDDYEHEPRRTRRRVFNLWSHYRDRQAKAGFFKLKGALCLSKTQWRAFHRLD
jgi:hypothetical protein